uniref:Uncharacterized protein n=2 Tax=Acrobeloides nanus TaxID=290746 RepID=A0A914CD37_9BILA
MYSRARFLSFEMPRRRKVYDDQASTMTVSVCADGPFNNPLDVKPTLNRFADDTSMLGFRYLHSRYKTWFRVLWAFVLVFFIGLTIYQVFERIGYYFIRNPLVTVRTYDSPTSIEFPTVVICNKMQLKASKIATIRPDLLKTMSLIYEDNQTPTKNPQIRDSLHEFDRVNLLNVYKQARQSDDDLFLSCQYKGRQCLDVIRPIITPNGLCYAVSLNETVQRPGPESTLSLLLNLEVYEAIPGWVTEQGIVISMFDSTVPETAHFIEGMHLEPGKLVTIPINDIRRLKRHSSGCGRSNCGGMFRPAEYSRAACHWTVKQDDIQKKCHCNALNSPLYRKMSFHSEIGAGSSSENGTVDNRTTRKPHRKSLVPVCTLKQELECVHRIKNEPLSGRALQQLQNCPQDCTDVSLTTIVFGNELDVNEISRFLPGDWEEEKEKRLKQFQIALDILPKYRIPVVQNIQKLADEAQQFLSDALELFEISNITNETHVPCTMEGEVGVFVRQMSRFHTEERLWRHVTNYAQLVLPHQLESLFKAIGIHLDRDSTFTIHKRDIDKEVDAESYQSQVAQKF